MNDVNADVAAVREGFTLVEDGIIHVRDAKKAEAALGRLEAWIKELESENERLAKEHSAAVDAANHFQWQYDSKVDELRAAEARVAELERALQEIDGTFPMSGYETEEERADFHWTTVCYYRKVARKALGKEET
jgi:hypothetical protein